MDIAFFVSALVVALASALRWGWRGAILGWLGGALVIMLGPVVEASFTEGYEASWAFALAIGFRMPFWLLFGSAAAFAGVLIRGLRASARSRSPE